MRVPDPSELRPGSPPPPRPVDGFRLLAPSLDPSDVRPGSPPRVDGIPLRTLRPDPSDVRPGSPHRRPRRERRPPGPRRDPACGFASVPRASLG
ncbi:hypothetical protein RSP03_30900 [Cereibacter sphaeroides]|nr:hypothetical protein RSP03_30900 [Cereibacter sphaeroides]